MSRSSCKEHNQKEWSCGKLFGLMYHIKKPDTVKFTDENDYYKQKRCCGCICENKDNENDDIQYCGVYGKIKL